jgi:hypothetical protein
MAEHNPPIKVRVTVTGTSQRQANIGAGLIQMALRKAGMPFATLDGVDTFGLNFEDFNPVILGDISFKISAVEEPPSG